MEKRVVEALSLERVEAEKKRLQYKSRYRRTMLSTVGVFIVAAAFAVLVAVVWMPILRVYSSSMSPTLEEGQIVIVLAGDDYKVGDLVAIWYGNKVLIKRVMAEPGDWIDIEDNGDVYVNGRLLEEPYLSEKSLGKCDQTFPIQVSEERWFVMGDNRASSVDSRSSLVGLVSREQVIGKIILRIWPITLFGFNK